MRCILTMCIINGTDNQFDVNDFQTLVGAIQNPYEHIRISDKNTTIYAQCSMFADTYFCEAITFKFSLKDFFVI